MKNDFFEVQSVEACEHILRSFAPVPDIEKVGLEQALSLVTARDIRAEEDLPAYSRSSMDGYAVRARDCFGAGESNPVYLSLKAQLAVDESPQMSLNPGECAEILTGGTLPSGADAVVMVEHTRQIAEDEIEVFRSLGPGDNIMLKGEDCKSGEIALGAGKRLRPQDLGVLAALGHSRVDVFRRPRVAILSTGDELVPVEEKPVPGKIRDVNSTTLAAWCSRAGAEPRIMGIVQDQQQDLEQAVAYAANQADCVLLSGGSSVGTRDLSIAVISALPHGRILAHGIALSPGKPTILAANGQIPVIGLPGQVTSAQVVMYVLGLPFLAHLGGEDQAFDRSRQARVWARINRNIASQQGREDYIRVKLIQDAKGTLWAEPVLAKSGLLRSLLHADGLLRIPAQMEGVLAGGTHEVWLV
ncbi:MAG: gephyrin-like molybdotransferase Glp [Desulfovermiculus sp.]